MRETALDAVEWQMASLGVSISGSYRHEITVEQSDDEPATVDDED